MNLEKPNTLERCPGFGSDMMEPNRPITIADKNQRDFWTGVQPVRLPFRLAISWRKVDDCADSIENPVDMERPLIFFRTVSFRLKPNKGV